MYMVKFWVQIDKIVRAYRCELLENKAQSIDAMTLIQSNTVRFCQVVLVGCVLTPLRRAHLQPPWTRV